MRKFSIIVACAVAIISIATQNAYSRYVLPEWSAEWVAGSTTSTDTIMIIETNRTTDYTPWFRPPLSKAGLEGVLPDSFTAVMAIQLVDSTTGAASAAIDSMFWWTKLWMGIVYTPIGASAGTTDTISFVVDSIHCQLSAVTRMTSESERLFGVTFHKWRGGVNSTTAPTDSANFSKQTLVIPNILRLEFTIASAEAKAKLRFMNVRLVGWTNVAPGPGVIRGRDAW